jgi:very-short-patch-repair endonuclease
MRPEAIDRSMADVAARQHGVVGLDQLLALGLSARAVSHRVAAGRLHRVHQGVFAVGHPALDHRGRWLAAVLACGDGAALSHASAAQARALLPGVDTVIHVAVPRPGARRPGAPVRVHRLATLRPADVERLGALSVTTVARTLLDLAATERPRRVARAVEAAEARGEDFAAVHALLADRAGQPGTAVLARLVAAPPEGTESVLEERLLDLVVGAGLPRPRVNALVGADRVDLLWERERLVVEADGRTHHATRRGFGEDRRRDARLHVGGFTVVRFTWADVVHDPAYVVATVRALLARGRSLVDAGRPRGDDRVR